MSEQDQAIDNQESNIENEDVVVEEEYLDDAQPTDTDDDQIDVVIEGEQPPEPSEEDLEVQKAPKWVKELREKDRKSSKRIKELESQLADKQKPTHVELGDKPTLESAGFDTDKYDADMQAWYERKREIDAQEAAQKAKQETSDKAWQDRLSSYEAKKSEVKTKVRDYDEAEEVARETLSQTQQGILIHAADNPELLIYHLGKNPQKAKELADIQDPIQFAFAAAKIDSKLKVQSRKPKTQPEGRPSGSASLSGVIDTHLDALEKEADRTGDRSKFIAYKKSLKK